MWGNLQVKGKGLRERGRMRYKMMKKKLTGYDAMYYFFRTFAPFYVKNCGQIERI